MSDSGANADLPPPGQAPGNEPLPELRVPAILRKPDLASILGLAFAIGLIIAAIIVNQSNANFFNIPSLMIVVLGTLAATAISFSSEELAKAWTIISHSMMRDVQKPTLLAKTLMDLSVISRKKGVLALSQNEDQIRKDPFLYQGVQLVVDGYSAEDVDRLLGQKIETLVEQHKRSASMLRRASEVAPAMGLIGTLVGLVQMLADLENPETIGPAMALALLTTFYGAILGTIVAAPMAGKLEKNASEQAMKRNLIKTAMVSIVKQENPRRLEMLLNSELPPSERIRYFD